MGSFYKIIDPSNLKEILTYFRPLQSLDFHEKKKNKKNYFFSF